MSFKIIFAGTPQFAVPVLQKLLTSKHEVIGVYTQPDRPAGRGRQSTTSPIKIFAQQHHLPVYQPKSLRDVKEQQKLCQLKPDIIVVVGYGMLLPKAVLEIPKQGSINVHPSLLPRWRGPTPVQSALLAGDKKTGVTVMQLNERIDAGDILKQIEYEIQKNDTSKILYEQLFDIGADLLMETLDDLQQGTVIPRPQNEAEATYTKKIQKNDAKIDWTLSAKQLANQVRAYNDWPVAFTIFNGQQFRIWKAVALNEHSTEIPGTVIRVNKQGIDVATGENVLRLLRVQLPGKKPLAVEDFVNAYANQFIPGKTRFVG